MIGESLPRLEDAALLTGRGRFIDDIDLAGQAWVRFLRSPHAHADILGIDDSEALNVPGAVALLRDGLETGPLDNRSPVRRRDGTPLAPAAFPAFARERVRYAGEVVAMAVAETAAAARDMADAVAVDYRPLDPAETEELFEWATGDAAEVEARFARAAHRIRIPLANNRISAAPLETRGALAEWDARDGRYTLFAPTQGPGQVQEALAKALGAARADVRVITPDVGGGFGMKNCIFAEQILLAHAARTLGRPLKWIDERAEAFLSDYHARDHDTVAELALDAEGQFLAIRTATRSDLGAYATGAGPVIPTDGGSRMLANVYRIPAVHAETVCRLSHTTPITAYRGAGKPEYGYIVERLVDEAARQLALDPAELRRRNMIRPEEMPWRTPTGLVYDSGDFAGNLDAALELADRAGFAERRRASEAAGRLRGFGFASYTEPDGYKDGRVTMRFDEEGLLTVTLTASSNGQGFATTFSQIAAAQLGLPVEAVRVLTGDSDIVGRGSGAGGSRVTTVAGAAMVRASERIVEKGRHIAAAMLEASEDDIAFEAGAFEVVGTDRRVSLREVAAASFNPAFLGEDMDMGLDAAGHFIARTYSFPNGTHVAEVEIDPETGRVRLERYSLVNDAGVVVNPMLLEGQLHGGIVQGIGQALMEHMVYDPETGQLLSGSFMDYAMPRAADVPSFVLERSQTPCLTNPLGVKGVGESGTTAALPAAMNAVADALASAGAACVQMPATPERIWRALRDRNQDTA